MEWMVDCSKWERMLRDGDLNLKERLIECIVYSTQELISRGKSSDLEEAEALLRYGEEVSRKYNIVELTFHTQLLRKKLEEKRARRRSGNK